MASLENGTSNAERSRRGIPFEFQSRDLPSRRLLGKGLSGIGYESAWKGARYTRKDFVGVQRDVFLQEATVLVGLKDHKNIVKTYGWTIDKRSCSLVLEYMDEDLLSFLQKRMDSKRGVVGKQSSTSTSTQTVDLPEAVDMMLQIATGVEYLHGQGLAHGDLKTKNILVTHRKDGAQSSKVLKVSDFGLVGTKRKSRYIVSRKVRKLDTVRWKSPESLKILSRRLHSSNGDEDETSSESESESTPSSVPAVSSACAGIKSSDVYSFALICSQILTGDTPYPYLDWKELMELKILSGRRPDLPDSCHPLLRELLLSCWGDPAERPSFSAVRMKLIRVQGLLTTAMGKRPQEATMPSPADSPAHLAAVVPSTEVSKSFGTCLSPKPSKGPAIVPSEWTASVATMRSYTPGIPSAASSAPSPPATAAVSQTADGTADTGSAVVPNSAFSLSPFKAWQKARVLSPSQCERGKSTNQWLLRRCLGLFTLPGVLQQGIQTHGAVWHSSVSQGPSLTSSCESNILRDMDMDTFLQYMVNPIQVRCAMSMPHRGADEATKSHMTAERHRRLRQKENFAALRRLVPIRSKDDKASILGDAIIYLEGLEASKSQVERQYEDLKLSYQDLEQRNRQLESSKSQVERQYEDLKLSHQELEQRNRQLESQVDDEFEDFISSYQEHRKKRREVRKNLVKNEFEDALSDLVLELPIKKLETVEEHFLTVCEKDEPKLHPGKQLYYNK